MFAPEPPMKSCVLLANTIESLSGNESRITYLSIDAAPMTATHFIAPLVRPPIKYFCDRRNRRIGGNSDERAPADKRPLYGTSSSK